jgi:uncharacterized membrane protein
MGDGRGWWMVMGWVWFLGFWALVLYAIYALSNRRPPETLGRPAEPDALELLARRYARGEISDDQYEVMRTRLMGAAADPATTTSARA